MMMFNVPDLNRDDEVEDHKIIFHCTLIVLFLSQIMYRLRDLKL